MVDARIEARLWFIQVLVDHRLRGPYCKCGFTAFRSGEHELHVADALRLPDDRLRHRADPFGGAVMIALAVLGGLGLGYVLGRLGCRRVPALLGGLNDELRL